MNRKTDEESALKKLKTYNKILALLLPLLIVLGAGFVYFYYGGFNNLPVYGSTSTPPVESAQSVEVLPQIIRTTGESKINIEKDPFEAPKKLTGIFYTSKRSIAILESGNLSYIVEKNDIIGNSSWTVTDIGKDSLTLQNGDRTEVLELEDVSVSQSDGAASALNDSVIVNIRNADIRDVLSCFGLVTDKNVIFTGQATQVNYSIKRVRAADALNYLLKTLGMDYIEDASTIIVGTRDTLTNDYFNSIALTQFNLKYLTSDVLAAQVDALGIPVKKILLDSNKKSLWLQGLPRELGKVRELTNLLDKAENASAQPTVSTLTPMELTYITAEQINAILRNMGIHSGFDMETNPKTLWVYGNETLISQVSDIKKKLDIEKNAEKNDESGSIIVEEINLDYMTAQEIIDIFDELDMDVEVITLNRKLQTLWMTGDSETVRKAAELIDTFDVYANANNNVFFVHKFVHISAKEGETRFSYLGMENIKTYTLNFPEYSKSMMVFCPQDYKVEVVNLLNQLDVKAERIKLPIDYSKQANGAYLLASRRDLIVSLTGIPAGYFTISGNVSRDATPHYIMYIEETPEVIQRVKDIIASIDNPLRESTSNTKNNQNN